MCIVFNLAQDKVRLYDVSGSLPTTSTRGQVLCGARSSYMVTDTRDMVTTLGIQFKPGGAFPFLPVPVSELNEQCIGLDDILGRQANQLREQLLACPAPHAKFAVIERWLLSRLRGASEPHPAVDFAISRFLDGPSSKVSDLLQPIGYSQRHFNQLFANRVGLTPKLFLRVRRFQRAIALVGTRAHIEWSDVALDCGYYDQSHFVHDFRSFSGITPGSYFGSRTPHINHVPIND